MKEYQKRLAQEKTELDAKLIKLNTFLQSKECAEEVPDPELKRLVRQSKIMSLYSDVLSERLDAI